MLNGITYIVRPAMQPSNRPCRIDFISAGSIQLLVGPASSAIREQMNVRSSTRATSLGSDRARKLSGRLSGIEPDERAGVDQLLAELVVLLLRPVAPVHPGRLAELDGFRHPFASRSCRTYSGTTYSGAFMENTIGAA